MSTALSCDTCDRPLEVRWRAATAEVDRVRVTAERLPELSCPAGHQAIPAAQAFDGYADALLTQTRDQLTVARKPVLPWRPQRCDACGTDLTMPGFRSERAVSISSAGLAVHTVRLDLPLLRCTDCAVENVPREAWDDTERALQASVAT